MSEAKRDAPAPVRRGEAGFTLLELLVSLVVLGFILAGLAEGVRFGERAANMQAASIARHADTGAAERVIRRLIAAMDPGTNTEQARINGGPSVLGFETDLGAAAEALGLGDAEVGLGVDAQHRLVLHWTPSLHAVRLGPAPPVGTAVLLDGVQSVAFAYWGHGPGGAGEWLSAWAERGIPPLIRIRLRFLPAEHRTWPDIIAATERQQPPS